MKIPRKQWPLELCESLKAAGTVALASLLLLWPAVLNGYPLFHYDSPEYVRVAFSLIPVHRSLFYSLFLRFTTLSGHLSLWAAIEAQALLTSALIYAVLRLERKTWTKPTFIGVLATLSALTPISWVVCELAADGLAPALLLSSYVILFRWKPASAAVKTLAAGAFCLSCVSHFSHPQVALLAVALIMGFHALFSAKPRPRIQWRRYCAIIGMSLMLFPALSLVIDRPVLPAGSPFLMLKKMVEDGTLTGLLAEECGRKKFLLCDHQDEVRQGIGRSDWFLWEWLDWEKYSKESYALLFATLQKYPGKFLAESSRDTLRQFTMFQVFFRGEGNQLPPFDVPDAVLDHHYPRDKMQFMGSRQRRDELEPILRAVSFVHIAVTWFAFAALIGLIFRKKSAIRQNDWLIFCALFLFANAAVCGFLSEITPRYQGRLTGFWLFSLILAVFPLRTKPRSAAPLP